jgi:dynein heavy chain
MFNEMRKTDLDQMRRTLEAVFIPAFSFKNGESDEGNLRNWSQKSREDMIDKLSSMSVETKAIEGQVLGNTELPLPIASYMDSLAPKDKKQIYEVIITKWKKLVKKVLKQDSETIFDSDQKAGPLEEIKFWDNRKDNLNYIFEQLISRQLNEVKTFLASQASHYIGPFDKLKEEVSQSKDEAEDNYRFLSTLKKYFEKLQSFQHSITEIKEVFVPIMHLIMLIQNSSNYYKSNTNLVILIRQICNEIITQSCK